MATFPLVGTYAGIDSYNVVVTYATDSIEELVRSTVDLAHSLGLRIVAEGIENLDALALVDDLGCDAAQGYLMGRPVPAEEFDLGPVAVQQPRESNHLKALVATSRRLSPVQPTYLARSLTRTG